MALIDCGCPTTSCGTKWITKFAVKWGLRETDLKRRPSKTTFVFGDGAAKQSKGFVTLPLVLGDRIVAYVKTEEIDADIPLLIGNSTLLKAKAVMDISNNKLRLGDETVDLHMMNSGHVGLKVSSIERRLPIALIKANKLTEENRSEDAESPTNNPTQDTNRSEEPYANRVPNTDSGPDVMVLSSGDMVSSNMDGGSISIIPDETTGETPDLPPPTNPGETPDLPSPINLGKTPDLPVSEPCSACFRAVRGLFQCQQRGCAVVRRPVAARPSKQLWLS